MNREEEMALRELAAGRCTIPSVVDAIGPLSLWSKQGFEAEIAKAVETEREACAALCLETEPFYGKMFADEIRARSTK